MTNYVKELRAQIGSRPLILVGATILVYNDRGEVLLQHRSDSKDWGLPGGAMEPGESLEETARRELYEETGLQAKRLELVGVYSGEEFYYRYPNGDETYNVIVLYKAVEVAGELSMQDGESLALAFFASDHYPELEKRAALILQSTVSKIK